MGELVKLAPPWANAAANDLLDQLPDAILGIDREARIHLANKAAGSLFGLGSNHILGQPVTDLLPEWAESSSFALTTTATNSDDSLPRSFETTGLHSSGRRLHLELTMRRHGSGTDHYVLLTIRDIGMRKQLERRKKTQTAELAASNAELLVLYEVSSTVNRSLDLAVMLTEVLKTITQLRFLQLQPRGAVFLVEGGQMQLAAHIGQHPAFVESHHAMSLGRCHCGSVAKTGQPLRVGLCHRGRDPQLACSAMPDHGHLIVPLRVNERVVGVLCLYVPPGVETTDAVMRTLLTAGNHVGLAVENARLYERARQSALHDALTGLANRRLVDLFLERQLARTKRYPSPFSVIMLDIDHFKRFNDRHGHQAGDSLLVRLAQIVGNVTRDVDLAARYGGEEFLVLLPDTPAHRAEDVAERLRESVAAATLATISLGVATSYNAATDKDDLVRQADAAMYAAKRSGRNRVVVSRGAAAGGKLQFSSSEPTGIGLPRP